MKLNRDQIALVGDFLRNRRGFVPDDILAGMELGIWLPERLRLDLHVPELPRAIPLEAEGPLFVSGSFTRRSKENFLMAFREGLLTYLLVRVEASWQCYINCNGEILEATCDEDKDATSLCCSGLRSKCGKG